MLIIDGRQGEGGGQILRTSLTLAALTQRPFRLEKIRAGRSRPGLRPQHLTAVDAVGTICGAHLQGDRIDATTLEFHPTRPPVGDDYLFDVSDAAMHGSAGSTTLILQAVLWPLLFAAEKSRITLRGGTHVPFSPSFHYVQNVYAPTVRRLAATFDVELTSWGWMPRGEGQITAEIDPISQLTAVELTAASIEEIHGRAAVTNLPGHIPHRMARRADNLIEAADLKSRIKAKRLTDQHPGAGIFLWLPHHQAGFDSLGRKGLPAQTVAETAVDAALAFIDSDTAVDEHLADQLLLPMSLARGVSRFTTARLTSHTITNAHLLRQWLDVRIDINGRENEPADITVHGVGYRPSGAN